VQWPQYWLNGEVSDCVSTADRGLQYGDGFFTTVLVKEGRLLNLAQHQWRLRHSAERLGFQQINGEQVLQQAQRWIEATPQAGDLSLAVLKVIVTRGAGGRGYEPPLTENPNVIFQWLPHPEFKPERALKSKQDWEFWQNSAEISAGVLQTRWGMQPLLAGLKHLNRLENVLARQELAQSHTGWFEGVMLDQNGNVISGTQSNIILKLEGQWTTPRLDNCGVAGTTLRGLGETVEISEETITLERLHQAESVVFCNAVRGVMSVSELDFSVAEGIYLEEKMAMRHYDLKPAETLRQQWQSYLEQEQATL
jgi:4-amino-4-deoxychorismate lyase